MSIKLAQANRTLQTATLLQQNLRIRIRHAEKWQSHAVNATLQRIFARFNVFSLDFAKNPSVCRRFYAILLFFKLSLHKLQITFDISTQKFYTVVR